MNRKLKTLAEWQVLQQKMVLLENRQVEQDKAIQWMKQEETHKVLAKLKRRNEKLEEENKYIKEVRRQQEEWYHQLCETTQTIKKLKENKKMEGLERERRKSRALCRALRKLMREIKTLAEWQVLQHKMVLLENRQAEQDKAIQWMKQEETHKVLAKLKRRNEKLRRRLEKEKDCPEEFSRRQKELHRQALEMIEKLENMKKNKNMKEYYREKSNARALCSEIRKLLSETEAVIARSGE
ncbi:hypothetical protein CRE_24251 [Caenorhabditis remanei]|uniref:Uncharacterized protein n=1 Tax=Caenorhabditis remanei TaxID=31234 RepID=E3NFU5_CAERE|nr:hypothetical protein CRE_24251 [Caenorhabditis remanei]